MVVYDASAIILTEREEIQAEIKSIEALLQDSRNKYDELREELAASDAQVKALTKTIESCKQDLDQLVEKEDELQTNLRQVKEKLLSARKTKAVQEARILKLKEDHRKLRVEVESKTAQAEEICEPMEVLEDHKMLDELIRDKEARRRVRLGRYVHVDDRADVDNRIHHHFSLGTQAQVEAELLAAKRAHIEAQVRVDNAQDLEKVGSSGSSSLARR